MTAPATDALPAGDLPAVLTDAPPAVPTAPLVPVTSDQRIEALDVVRGFALLGIFLMNIEWFNRPFAAFNEGIPRDATSLDWWASWFVNYFVQGKFWTIFSMLFGMGFAVMLVRAERAGRAGPEFKKIYLRRILALAVFGALHYIFIWQGDILFSYAVGALWLLVVLYGTAKQIIGAIVLLIVLGFIPEGDPFRVIAGGLAAVGLLALYLRSDKRVKLLGRRIPLFSFILMLAGGAATIAGIVFWLLPDGPIEPRWPLSVFGPLVAITGWLSWKYFEPEAKRSLRVAVAIYFFFAALMMSGSFIQQFAPDPAALGASTVGIAPATGASAAGVAVPPATTTATVAATATATATSKAEAKADGKSAKADAPKKKSKEERAAEMREERAKRLAEGVENKAKEIAVFTGNNYWAAVDLHARHFVEKAAGDAGFGVGLVGMFLLGMWFVRSGVMDNTRAHLPLFRKLAFYALPIGILIGMLGSLIAVSHTPGVRNDGWGIARGLVMFGNLPACLGYVGLVVVLLHSNSVFSRIRVLGPLGRMALTNYLSQSIICAIYFYGYGLGHWGLSRSGQLLFVAIVYALQIAFSHWWLARFRYGPMEWLWRGFTYRQVPPFRIAPAGGPAAVGAA